MRHGYAKSSGSALQAMGFKPTANVNEAYAAAPGELVAVDATTAETTITLPKAFVARGQQVTVKKVAGSNDVIISGDIQIDAQAEIRLSVVGSAMTFVSNGDEWYVI